MLTNGVSDWEFMSLVPDGNNAVARRCAVGAVCTKRPFSTEKNKISALSEHNSNTDISDLLD